MIEIAVVLLLIFLVLGMPVCFAIGLSGFIAIVSNDLASFMAVQQAVRGVNSFALMAGPLFILAGEILGSAKLSQRILDFCRAVIGSIRGGMGIVTVMSNMIFAGISGSGAATMSAIGSLTVPELKKVGYSRSFSASLIAGSGALAPIIPPSTNMIVYASLTGFSVGRLFLGGLGPGILIGFGLMIMCYIYARIHQIDAGSEGFQMGTVWVAFKDAFWALITPVIIIGGVTTGLFTATESGVVACLYALVCGLFIYKTLKPADLLGIFKRATATSSMLMMIMGISNIYAYIFARENIATLVYDAVLSISDNATIIMLLIILVMLVIGCFMETLAAMAVILPIVYPIVVDLGIDPLQFGVLFSIATVVGGLTPPIGLYLFLSMKLVGATFQESVRYMVIVVLIVLFVMIGIFFCPIIVSFIPDLLMPT